MTDENINEISNVARVLQIGKDAQKTQNNRLMDVPPIFPGEPSNASPVRPRQRRRGVAPFDRQQDRQLTLNDYLDADDSETTMRILLRYGRLAELFQSATAIGESRVERYREYDIMADASLMSSFLEMLVDDASQQSHETNLTLWPSETCKYKKEIEDFLQDINNEELISGWMFELAKYGDWFVRLEIDETGIVRIRDDYHPSEIWRIDVNGALLGFAYQENIFSSNATYAYGSGVQPASIVGSDEFVHFIYNYRPHFDKIRVKLPRFIEKEDDGTDYKWYEELKSSVQRLHDEQVKDVKALTESKDKGLDILKDIDNEVQELVEWLGVDFQPDKDKAQDDFIYAVVTAKYGSSAMHNSRKDYKILNLVEQSLALARLARSPVARIFYVDTTNANLVEREEMIDYVERKFSMSESFDADSMLYKDSYVPLGYLDDIVFPVTGQKGDVRAEQIGGDVDVKSIVDIDYFLNKVFSGIRVPKAFMGYEEMLPGLSAAKSLTALDIRYARSAKKLQRSYINGMKRLISIHLKAKLHKKIKLNDIDLEMVSISSAEELERVDVISSRLDIIERLAEVIDQIGGNKRMAVKDMLQDSADVFSLVEIRAEWFDPPKDASVPVTEPDSVGSSKGTPRPVSAGAPSIDTSGGPAIAEPEEVVPDAVEPDSEE